MSSVPRIYAYPTQDKIVAALEHLGEATIAEITAHMGDSENIYDSFRALQKRVPMHIVGYKRNLITRGLWAKIWALGKGKDAQAPTETPMQDGRERYAENKRLIIRAKSRLRTGFKPNKWADMLGIRLNKGMM